MSRFNLKCRSITSFMFMRALDPELAGHALQPKACTHEQCNQTAYAGLG